MSIGPALILGVLVGIFHASLYVLIRGNAGGRLPIIVVAAILGAWAGDALADRLGFDVLMIGDFHLLGGIDRGLDRDRRRVGGGDPRASREKRMSRRDGRRATGRRPRSCAG